MEGPEFLESRAAELMTMEQVVVDRRGMWAVVLGLKPVVDGNQYCILWGDDLQSGVAGFGDIPYDAIYAFEKVMVQNVSKNKK